MHNPKPVRYKVILEGETMSQETINVALTVNPGTSPNPFVVKDGQGNVVPDGGTVTLSPETVGVSDPGQTVVVLSGGTAPYSIALANGSKIPDGDQLNSTVNADGSETVTLSGTPTTAGDGSFSLLVADAAGASSTVGVARKKIA